MDTTELTLPEFATGEDAAFGDAVRVLRDHLLGAVDVDREIRLNGCSYAVAWADRRPTKTSGAAFSLASGMRVMDFPDAPAPAIVASGEEQIALVVDGERLIFHLVEVGTRAANFISGRWKDLE